MNLTHQLKDAQVKLAEQAKEIQTLKQEKDAPITLAPASKETIRKIAAGMAEGGPSKVEFTVVVPKNTIARTQNIGLSASEHVASTGSAIRN